MNFIAVLDFEHLDNGIFLTAFARSLARRKKRGIIIHSDSEYTNRLIQTGMMREDAMRRSIRDLNHRLVALFADQGVPTIALNGYQKAMVTAGNGSALTISRDEIDRLPEQPMLLLSGLAHSADSDLPVPVNLPDFAFSLQRTYSVDAITLFSTSESSSIIKSDLPKRVALGKADSDFLEEHIPESFHGRDETVILSTADAFGKED